MGDRAAPRGGRVPDSSHASWATTARRSHCPGEPRRSGLSVGPASRRRRPLPHQGSALPTERRHHPRPHPAHASAALPADIEDSVPRDLARPTRWPLGQPGSCRRQQLLGQCPASNASMQRLPPVGQWGTPSISPLACVNSAVTPSTSVVAVCTEPLVNVPTLVDPEDEGGEVVHPANRRSTAPSPDARPHDFVSWRGWSSMPAASWVSSTPDQSLTPGRGSMTTAPSPFDGQRTRAVRRFAGDRSGGDWGSRPEEGATCSADKGTLSHQVPTLSGLRLFLARRAVPRQP